MRRRGKERSHLVVDAYSEPWIASDFSLRGVQLSRDDLDDRTKDTEEGKYGEELHYIGRMR